MPSIRMALLFGILTPASAQFEPDKHAPNRLAGWGFVRDWFLFTRTYFLAFLDRSLRGSRRRAMGTRNGLHET